MDIDPLSDNPPPRHAIESDEEEEDEYNPLHPSPDLKPNPIAVAVVGDLPQRSNIIFATGDVAKYWARGASLGEQSGGIYVNKVQIGLLFSPVWTTATIIISETLTRLPIWAMHRYAEAILDTLKPSKLSLLDTYPIPSYVSGEPVRAPDAPLRYLATSAVGPPLVSEAEPFSPPNLIQSTSASFLTLLDTKYRPTPGTLLLVPSPHIPQLPPKLLTPSNFSHLSEDRFEWPRDQINTAQRLVFLAVGDEEPPKWEYNRDHTKEHVPKQNRQFGEGGMYI